jgi:hypothetical protein
MICPWHLIETGGVATTTPATGELTFRAQPELVRSSGNTLFTSGTMSKYSHMLNAVMESPGALYLDPNKTQESARQSLRITTWSRRARKNELLPHLRWLKLRWFSRSS